MHSDIWYDLAIRELSDLSDPATEKLVEAAATSLPVPATNEESAPAVPRRWSPPRRSSARCIPTGPPAVDTRLTKS